MVMAVLLVWGLQRKGDRGLGSQGSIQGMGAEWLQTPAHWLSSMADARLQLLTDKQASDKPPASMKTCLCIF